ncbi:ABC transporter substrate-binding protein [Clostridium cochlearium]|uniref:ABC-type glycerol-3-phosphate transport system, substrate-binding protein n=1 Tax=Clostridium cochlearium TaxID=1494 RepID=A0ABY0QL75_CLOCO|nr:extracellular solute-binding protein [Clostridium cochlearium]MCG4579501.1 extracellular solute-binding protein [Clostridium cochlearium]SDL13213.1 ABC-type glycerol-3-phosphate transport system, substrate-binding protein [Clostridium cochlearium]
MNNRKIRTIIYCTLIILILFASGVYKLKYYKSYANEKENLPPELKDKTIVRLWMKKSVISPTRSYQIEKFNKQNKDNIHIIFTEYKEDYYNAIRTTLASGNGPDIFEYGFSTLMKNEQVASLDKINIDMKNIDKSNIVKFKDMPLGIKLMETNVKFIWNKDLFKKAGLDPNKPPQNWEEVIAYSKIIKDKFPEVTPFAFPLKEYEDVKVSIGEPSVNSGNIYTSFWDYKEGKYNFNYAKEILNIYNKMYKLNYIDENFDKKSRNQLRSEFYQNNIAMMISTFEDKGYFSNILPLNFDMGVEDLIQVNNNKNNIYYYVQNMNFLVVNNESVKDENKKFAIKKVYEHLLSEDVNREVLRTRSALPVNVKDTKVNKDIYDEYNKIDKYKNEDYDPTIFLSRNSSLEINLILDAIKGDKTIDESIKGLNEQYDNYFKFAEEKENFDFKYYKK